MQTRQIDPQDDALLAKYQETTHRAHMHERPWESTWSLVELRSRVRGRNTSDRIELYATFDGEVLLGGAMAEFPLLDNTDKVYVDLGVDPNYRRRGVGSALIDFLVSRCEQEGRSTVIGESSYPLDRRETHPHRLFAEKNGFSLANTEIVRELRLPVPESTLDAMTAEALPFHEGYRIQTYVDQIPQEYVASYCYLINQLVLDAPQGEMEFEEEAITPEVYWEDTARLKASGRSRYSTLAIDRDGVVVAQTDLLLPVGEPHKMLQWGTLVRRDHRGHHLGAAVKLANLRAVQRDQPERTTVSTSNAEVNAAMVGINERLGFVPVAILPMFQRRL